MLPQQPIALNPNQIRKPELYGTMPIVPPAGVMNGSSMNKGFKEEGIWSGGEGKMVKKKTSYEVGSPSNNC